MTRRPVALGVCVTLIGCGLAACAATPAPPSIQWSPTATPTTAPAESPTPTPSEPPDPLAPVKVAVQKYWALEEHVAKDPVIKDPNLIASVAIDQAATSLALSASSYREQKLRFEGTATRRGLSITAPTTESGTTTSKASYCDDNSGVKVFDAAGKLVVRQHMVFPTTLTLTLMPNGRWVASHITNSATPC